MHRETSIPPHTDEVFATKVAGYGSMIAHGMFTMGMTGHLVTDLVGVGHIATVGGRFVGVVRPGDTWTARATFVRVGPDEDDSFVEISLATFN